MKRFLAPVAFLAAVTIAVVLVRSGLQHGKPAASPPATATTSKVTVFGGNGHHHHRRAHRRAGATNTYTVQSGDTFDSIARKTGTTVAQLEQLNPGVNPSALQVGQTIRVR